MAWAGSAMCTSFKKELLTGTHNFAAAGHTFKIALYDNTGLSAANTVYTSGSVPANEITNVSGTGYTAGGQALAGQQDPATTGTTAFTGWTTNPSWTSSTFNAYGAMIYNTSASNKAVCVLDFGGLKPVSAGTFTIVMPTNDASNALIRIA